MHRRCWMAAGLGLLLAACSGVPGAGAQPRYTVLLAQLQEKVAQKFPRSVPLSGLVDITFQAPRLRLLPGVNRLGAEMAVDATGAALRRSYTGALDVEFALRYEPSDRTLRAHQLRLNRLDFPGLSPAVTKLLNTYGTALAEQSLGEVVLHTLRPQDTTVFDSLGLQPGPITITDQGLVVGLVRQQRGQDDFQK